MKTRLLLFILFSYLNSFSQEVGLVANFPFNNSVTSTVNGESFYGPVTYTTDRNGVVNNALSRTGGLISTNIAAIPVGSSARTVSVWFKLPANSSEKVFLEYGDGTSNSRFFIAASEFQIPSMEGFSFGAPPFYQLTNSAIASDVWYHYVVTTNASGVVKQYINGAFLATYTGTINTSSNTTCYIDGGYNGAIDDLKIYNRELTSVEVLNLYNNNTTLSSSDFSQDRLEVKLYPNPVRDILYIEIEKDIKSIEIYNIQGQKVLSSNQKQINVSDLAAGMYMVRIQDTDNNIATKKIVIK